MGPLGAQEMICIFVLALLLFGPKKLPELGRMLGKAVSEFRRAKSELKATFETHLNELERETRTSLDTTTATTNYSSPEYPYPYDDYGRYDSEYGSTSTPNDSTPANSSSGDSGSEPEREYAQAESHPVEGTVPRSNGTRPVEPVPVSTEEEHHG
ncbi:MAG TPA: twin-arginine translocase TatA/TatE family subunit [Bryobacteraceae bacterium]|nr:twin-arginine translocase TatA/TatE family subunit [Bryobacteraceae bacterium]